MVSSKLQYRKITGGPSYSCTSKQRSVMKQMIGTPHPDQNENISDTISNNGQASRTGLILVKLCSSNPQKLWWHQTKVPWCHYKLTECRLTPWVLWYCHNLIVAHCYGIRPWNHAILHQLSATVFMILSISIFRFPTATLPNFQNSDFLHELWHSYLLRSPGMVNVTSHAAFTPHPEDLQWTLLHTIMVVL